MTPDQLKREINRINSAMRRGRKMIRNANMRMAAFQREKDFLKMELGSLVPGGEKPDQKKLA